MSPYYNWLARQYRPRVKPVTGVARVWFVRKLRFLPTFEDIHGDIPMNILCRGLPCIGDSKRNREGFGVQSRNVIHLYPEPSALIYSHLSLNGLHAILEGICLLSADGELLFNFLGGLNRIRCSLGCLRTTNAGLFRHFKELVMEDFQRYDTNHKKHGGQCHHPPVRIFDEFDGCHLSESCSFSSIMDVAEKHAFFVRRKVRMRIRLPISA
jgi:hypothetical protein